MKDKLANYELYVDCSRVNCLFHFLIHLRKSILSPVPNESLFLCTQPILFRLFRTLICQIFLLSFIPIFPSLGSPFSSYTNIRSLLS